MNSVEDPEENRVPLAGVWPDDMKSAADADESLVSLADVSSNEDKTISAVSSNDDRKKPKSITVADWLPARVVLLFLGFLGFINNYLMRFNMSIAIVAMVNNTAIPHVGVSAQNLCNNGSGEIEEQDGNTKDGPYAWTEYTQGVILSSFFWGYACTQIIGGRLCERFGFKYVIGVGLVTCALCGLLIPVAASLGYGAVIVLRFLQGFFTGVTYPSIYPAAIRWSPLSEQSRFISSFNSGGVMGMTLVFPLSGLIIESYGWEAVFYVTSGLTLVWAIFWWMLSFNSPEEHPRITEKEKHFIISTRPDGQKHHKKPPWRRILTSIRVWAIIVASLGNGWSLFTLLSGLPTYMKHILGLNIKVSGFLTGLPYLCRAIFMVGFAWFTDFLLKKRLMAAVNVRKLSVSIALLPSALCFIAISFTGCDVTSTITLLVIAVGCTGAISAAAVNYLEIAPAFSGSVYGVGNTLSSVCGFITPVITGALTDGNQSLESWIAVFCLTAGICIICGSFYVLFASSEVQPWNYPREGKTQENPSKTICDKKKSFS